VTVQVIPFFVILLKANMPATPICINITQITRANRKGIFADRNQTRQLKGQRNFLIRDDLVHHFVGLFDKGRSTPAPAVRYSIRCRGSHAPFSSLRCAGRAAPHGSDQRYRYTKLAIPSSIISPNTFDSRCLSSISSQVNQGAISLALGLTQQYVRQS
jgi:hypothetical protein